MPIGVEAIGLGFIDVRRHVGEGLYVTIKDLAEGLDVCLMILEGFV